MNTTTEKPLADIAGIQEATPSASRNAKLVSSLETREEVAKTPLLDKLALGMRNSGYGQILYRARASWDFDDDQYPEDEAFKAALPQRVLNDMPGAPSAEQEYLATAANEYEYNILKNVIDTKRKELQFVSESTAGTIGQFAGDVSLDLIGGALIGKAAAKLADGAKRMAVGVGGNAALSVGTEVIRQNAMQEDSDPLALAVAGAVGGLTGAWFDGKSAAFRQKLYDGMWSSSRKSIGLKPKATIEPDDAKPIGTPDTPSVSPSAKPTTPVTTSSRLASLMAPVRSEAADNLEWSKVATKLTANDYLNAALRANKTDIVAPKLPEAPTTPANIENLSISKDFEKLTIEEPKTIQGTTPESTVKDAQVVEQFKQEGTFLDFRNPDTYVPQNMRTVAELERSVPSNLLEGRLKIRHDNVNIKPVFESPVDRSLAFVGANSDEAIQPHMDVLRKAFKGATDEEILDIAQDYVENHVLTAARLMHTGAPRMPRFFDGVDMTKYRKVDPASVLASDTLTKWTNNAQVTSKAIPAVDADLDGVLRDAAVSEANKLVTEAHTRSGFRLVAAGDPLHGLSRLMKGYFDALKLTTNAIPDAHSMRVFAAKQIYARKLYDAAVKAGKATEVTPKMVALSVGVAAFGVTLNAQAGQENVFVSAGLEGALLLGGSILFGAAAAKKAAKAAGAWTTKDQRKLKKAQDMLTAGTDPDAILKSTGYRVVELDGVPVLHKDMQPQEFVALTGKSSVAELEEMAQAVRIKDGDNITPVSLHMDFDKDIQALADIASNPYETLTVFGKQIKLPKLLDNFRQEHARMQDDPSVTLQGLAQLLVSGNMTRVGKVAKENDADSFSRQLHTAYVGETEDAYSNGFREYLKEPGAPRGGYIKNGWAADAHSKWNAELKRAHDDPGAPDLSPAAVKARDTWSTIRAKTIEEAKGLLEAYEKNGHTVSPQSPLRAIAALVNDPTYYRRVADGEKFTKAIEKLGAQTVNDMLTEAFKNANPELVAKGLSDAKFASIGNSFFRGYSKAIGDDTPFIPDDIADNLQEILQREGIPQGQIDTILSNSGLSRKTSAPTITKRRSDLDLSVSRTITNGDGTESVSVADFFVDDMFRLQTSWGKQLNGIIGLAGAGLDGAKRGIDLSDSATWNAIAAKAVDEGADPRNLKYLHALRDSILGHDFDRTLLGGATALERSIGTLTTWPLAQGFGLAMAGEFGHMGAVGAARAVMRLGDSITATMRVGGEGMDKGVVRDLAAILSTGASTISARVNLVNEHVGRTISNKIDKVSRVQMVANGVVPEQLMIEMGVAGDLTTTLLRYAQGDDIGDDFFKHQSAFGLDKATADNLKHNINRFFIKSPDGVLEGIDHQAWKHADINGYWKFTMWLRRAVNDANSSFSGVSETPQALRTSQGLRIYTKFMNTAIAATQRTFKEGMNFDSGVAGKWALSFMMATMASYLRIYLKFWNDEEELQRQLTPVNLAVSGLRLSSFSGIYMNGLDAVLMSTGFPTTTETIGTASGRSSGAEPALSGAVRTYLTAIRAANGALFGSETDRFTYKEILATQATVAPLLIVQVLTSIAAQDAPRTNDKKPKLAGDSQ